MGDIMKKLFSLFIACLLSSVPAFAGNINNPQTAILSNVSGTLQVAHGGTGNTTFLTPAGGCDPIFFYDGTKFATNSVVTDLCYNTTSNTVYTGALNISAASLTTAIFTNTTATSPTQGAGMIGLADDAAPMGNGDRLGYYTLGGAYNTTHSTYNAVAMTGFATEAWSATNRGAELRLEVTPKGSTTRAAKLTVTASNGTSIVGTTTNDNACVGCVGEYLEIAATNVALTSGVISDVATLPLTSGDWDVFGVCGVVPAAAGTVTQFAYWSNDISATLPALGRYGNMVGSITNPSNWYFPIPTERYSLAAATNVYATVSATFSGTAVANCVISARRIR